MVAFCAGVIAAAWLPRLPELTLLVLLLPLAVLLCWLGPRARAAGCLILGVVHGVFVGHQLITDLLPADAEGRDLAVRVCVIGLPEVVDGRFGPVTRFDARLLEPLSIDGERWSGDRLRLSLYASRDLRPGQQLRTTVRLKRPRGFVNPGGFDYQAALLADGIHATGYIRDQATLLIEDGSADCRASLDRIRRALRDGLLALQGDSPAIGPLLALTLGDRSRLQDEDWQRFAATGTTHLMVISGLHISLVAGLAGVIGTRLARCSPRVLLRLPATHVGWLCALLPATAYAALAGFSIPTRRALLMLLVALIVQLCRRNVSYWTALVVSASVVLLLEPMAPLERGFWLSFGAVAGLLLGMGGRLDRPGVWQGALRAQWVATLAMLVPLAVGALPQPLLSPLVNLVAIPLISILVVPAALLGLVLIPWPMVADWPLSWAGLVLTHFMQGLVWLESLQAPMLPGAGALPAVFAVVAGLGVVLLLLPGGFPGRALAGLLIAPLFVLRPDPPALGAVGIRVLDVGQGTAVIVRTAHHALVYDTGPLYSTRFDAGSGVVAPALAQWGIRRVDMLVLSHSDMDHVGGAPGLLASLPVTQVVSGQPVSGMTALTPCAGLADWQWDGVRFSVLHPHGRAYRDDNNHSCVLRIEAGGTAVLLTGDIEARVEGELLAAGPAALRSAVMLMPHHGSKTSSTTAFIRTVAPRWVIATAGWRSRFGHPHPEVVARYEREGIEVLNTAGTGAVEFSIDAQGALTPPRVWRDVARRYWFD